MWSPLPQPENQSICSGSQAFTVSNATRQTTLLTFYEKRLLFLCFRVVLRGVHCLLKCSECPLSKSSPEQRSCHYCSKCFLPKRKDQVFHSKQCQRAAVRKRYHLDKFQTGAEKRSRYSSRKINEVLTEQKLEPSEYLHAMAACAEAEQQIRAWLLRKQTRESVLAKLPRPSFALRTVLLKDGEPPPAAMDREVQFGFSSTDGLIAVVVFARPV